MIKGLASVMDTGASNAARSDNPASHSADAMGYNNSAVVYGPIDVIKRTMVRDKGLEFAQTCTLVFEMLTSM